MNQFRGTLVWNGWFSDKRYQQYHHSLCNAHLLRNLTFIGEAYPNNESWTDNPAKLLLEIKVAVEKALSNNQTQFENSLKTDFLGKHDEILFKAELAIRSSHKAKNKFLSAPNLHRRFIKNKV